ncbi:MAG TPA: hypothetical protein VK194_03550 [Candidatus Deferrimicrobium sp.]|nr:hypothetical protein [Candidatus Deferrimicrobium sp.]
MQPDPVDDAPSGWRLPIGEDWLATIVGLALVGLVLLGVLTKSMVP